MTGTPTHESWCGMRERCRNPNAPRAASYYKKGIKVCRKWDDFATFLADMGERPKGTTLERIDNNRGYEPGNCQWATPKAQAINRSTTVLLTFRGETLCKSDWARRLGIRPYALNLRIRKFGVTKALTMKRGASGPKPTVQW